MDHASALQPTAKEYLESLVNNVFIPLTRGQSVTLITYSGAGKWANIKYIIDNCDQYAEQLKDLLYLPLKTTQLIFSSEEEFINGITFMIAKATASQHPLPSNLIEKLHEKKTIQDASATLLEILQTCKRRLVIVVDNAEKIFHRDRYSKVIISFINSLISIDVTKVSALFITKGETNVKPSEIGPIERFYFQRVVTEREIPFDKSSATVAVQNFIKENQLNSSDEVREAAERLSAGDPFVCKQILIAFQNDKNFEKLLVKQDDIGTLYANLNDTLLDSHFATIINNLSPQSKDYLYGLSVTPPKYLLDANLVSDNQIINPLFNYYVKERSQRFPFSAGEVQLTAQEERLLQLLTESLGKTITREMAAQAIWGESWMSHFSEQGIDKIVSNLRAKLTNSPYKVKSIKKQGLIAEKSGIE